MRTDFRQGIISYPTSDAAQTAQSFLIRDGDYVKLETTNGRVDVTFAHKDANYLLTESQTVEKAWGPIPNNVPVWLYWDIDKVTGQRTFGYTNLEPTVGIAPPANPQDDQHWFDTTTNTMKVFRTGMSWMTAIRVFAAKLRTSTFNSLGSNPDKSFGGSQIGDSTISNSGRIAYDDTGYPILKHNDTFFTITDQFFIQGSPANSVALDAAVLQARAFENMAAFYVVKWVDFDTIALANYQDQNNTVVGMLVEDVTIGNVATVVPQGVITNPLWNWPMVGASMWIGKNGHLVTADPFLTDPVEYTKSKPPVARVLSKTSILFDQGMGGVGEKGDTGTVGAHRHPATQIDVQPHDAWFNQSPGALTNGQQALNELADGKVNKAGDTMDGFLTLVAAPNAPLHAATKSYVDNKRLDDLLDVDISAPQNNNLLTFDSTSATWKNKPFVAVTSLNANTGAVTIEQGTNVTVNNSTPGKVVISAHDIPLSVSQNGTNVVADTRTVNFVGANWTVADGGSGRVNVSVEQSGGGTGESLFTTDHYDALRGYSVVTPKIPAGSNSKGYGILSSRGPLVSDFVDPLGSSRASYCSEFPFTSASDVNDIRFVKPGPTVLGRVFYSGVTTINGTTQYNKPAVVVMTTNVTDTTPSRIKSVTEIDCGQSAVLVSIVSLGGGYITDQDPQRVFITAVAEDKSCSFLIAVGVALDGTVSVTWKKKLSLLTAGPQSLCIKEGGTVLVGDLLLAGFNQSTRKVVITKLNTDGEIIWSNQINGLTIPDALGSGVNIPPMTLHTPQYSDKILLTMGTTVALMNTSGVLGEVKTIAIPAAVVDTTVIDGITQSPQTNSNAMVFGRYQTANVDRVFFVEIGISGNSLTWPSQMKVIKQYDNSNYFVELVRPVMFTPEGMGSFVAANADVTMFFIGQYGDDLPVDRFRTITGSTTITSTALLNNAPDDIVSWATASFGYSVATYTSLSKYDSVNQGNVFSVASSNARVMTYVNNPNLSSDFGTSSSYRDCTWTIVSEAFNVPPQTVTATVSSLTPTIADTNVVLSALAVNRLSNGTYVDRYAEDLSTATDKSIVANSMHVKSTYYIPGGGVEGGYEGGRHSFIVSETGVWNLGLYPAASSSADYVEGENAGKIGQAIVSQGPAAPPKWAYVDTSGRFISIGSAVYTGTYQMYVSTTQHNDMLYFNGTATPTILDLVASETTTLKPGNVVRIISGSSQGTITVQGNSTTVLRLNGYGPTILAGGAGMLTYISANTWHLTGDLATATP